MCVIFNVPRSQNLSFQTGQGDSAAGTAFQPQGRIFAVPLSGSETTAWTYGTLQYSFRTVFSGPGTSIANTTRTITSDPFKRQTILTFGNGNAKLIAQALLQSKTELYVEHATNQWYAYDMMSDDTLSLGDMGPLTDGKRYYIGNDETDTPAGASDIKYYTYNAEDDIWEEKAPTTAILAYFRKFPHLFTNLTEDKTYLPVKVSATTNDPDDPNTNLNFRATVTNLQPDNSFLPFRSEVTNHTQGGFLPLRTAITGEDHDNLAEVNDGSLNVNDTDSGSAVNSILGILGSIVV